MASVKKKKVFYQIDEACALLGLSLLDMAVLVSEGRIQLSATVGALLVEDGRYEIVCNDKPTSVPTNEHYVRGLVDLRPEDAWYVLRAGSQMIFWLSAKDGHYRRLVSKGEDECGYSVIRDEVGVRHAELVRYAAIEEALGDIVMSTKTAKNRGSQHGYDWEGAQLVAFERIYFDGVPESYGALIRHVEAWFVSKGGKVPDESTLKRRLRNIWTKFGPEGAQNEA